MAMVRMEISTLVIANGPVASVVVLRERDEKEDGAGIELPIRIGRAEARALSMASGSVTVDRPMTVDLLAAALKELGASVERVAIVSVDGPIFHADIEIVDGNGTHHHLDARPSDALALALKAKAPMFVDEDVLAVASMPAADRSEMSDTNPELEEFRAFVAGLMPDDFSSPEP